MGGDSETRRDTCDVCRESTKYRGYGPWRRLKPGSMVGPACFKRVEDKYEDGCLRPAAAKRLLRHPCIKDASLRFDNWEPSRSCLIERRANTVGRIKIDCSLCGFKESEMHIKVHLLKCKRVKPTGPARSTGTSLAPAEGDESRSGPRRGRRRRTKSLSDMIQAYGERAETLESKKGMAQHRSACDLRTVTEKTEDEDEHRLRHGVQHEHQPAQPPRGSQRGRSQSLDVGKVKFGTFLSVPGLTDGYSTSSGYDSNSDCYSDASSHRSSSPIGDYHVAAAASRGLGNLDSQPDLGYPMDAWIRETIAAVDGFGLHPSEAPHPDPQTTRAAMATAPCPAAVPASQLWTVPAAPGIFVQDTEDPRNNRALQAPTLGGAQQRQQDLDACLLGEFGLAAPAPTPCGARPPLVSQPPAQHCHGLGPGHVRPEEAMLPAGLVDIPPASSIRGLGEPAPHFGRASLSHPEAWNAEYHPAAVPLQHGVDPMATTASDSRAFRGFLESITTY